MSFIEAKCDLWSAEADARCITTNGYVRKNGAAVLGRGVALQATKRFPDLEAKLGERLAASGNRVYVFPEMQFDGATIVTFPVKPNHMTAVARPSNVVRHMRKKFKVGDEVPGWATTAQPPLIRRSAYDLIWHIEQQGWQRVLLPRPGCGAGELKWPDVKAILEPILDERVWVITAP
jgi:hypothetical protein